MSGTADWSERITFKTRQGDLFLDWKCDELLKHSREGKKKRLLKIDMGELVDAFDSSGYERSYFLDLKMA